MKKFCHKEWSVPLPTPNSQQASLMSEAIREQREGFASALSERIFKPAGGKMNTEAGTRKLYELIKPLTKQQILRLSKLRCEHRHNILAHPECLKKALEQEEKVAMFDIESTALNASYGFMLCYAIKPIGEEGYVRSVTTKDIRTGQFDKRITGHLMVDLMKYDRIVTFNGNWFDIPFVRTRALFHGLPFPVFGTVRHTDLYQIARKRIKTHSRKLEVICEFFGIPAKQHKFNPKIWMGALAGDSKSLEHTKIHCLEDVVSTEQVYKMLMPYEYDGKKSL